MDEDPEQWRVLFTFMLGYIASYFGVRLSRLTALVICCVVNSVVNRVHLTWHLLWHECECHSRNIWLWANAGDGVLFACYISQFFPSCLTVISWQQWLTLVVGGLTGGCVHAWLCLTAPNTVSQIVHCPNDTALVPTHCQPCPNRH